MFRYSGFGLSIHSELAFPNLPAGSEHPDVVIRYGQVPHERAKATMHEEIAHHARAGSFYIKHGTEIVMDPPPGVDPDLLRALLLGRMMAFLLRQREWLPLHASGVAIGAHAILFLGASRAGKSTTAAAFYARGHQVITDDVAAVRVVDRQCLVRPAGPRIRLFDNSRAAFGGQEPASMLQWRKYVFNVGRGQAPESMPVSRIYVLGDGDQIKTEVIPPLSAVAALSTHSVVRRERMDEDSLSAHFRDCTAVARSLRIERLVRPRSLADLPELVRWVESDLGS